MATVGLSKPYFALYTASGTTVTYSDFGALGKAVELSVDLDDNNDNVLYADNAAAESVASFSGGTLTITTDDLLLPAASKVLGLTQNTLDTPSGSEVVYKADSSAPYVGFGVIVKKIQSGTPAWMAVVFPKVQFSNPGVAATTQGETIDWQTPELTANIMRDDTADGVWQRWAQFSTEADAQTYVASILNPTAGG